MRVALGVPLAGLHHLEARIEIQTQDLFREQPVPGTGKHAALEEVPVVGVCRTGRRAAGAIAGQEEATRAVRSAELAQRLVPGGPQGPEMAPGR